MSNQKTQKTKRKGKIELAPWIKEALPALRPPENISGSKWADEYRIVSAEVSAYPGRWKTDFVPYTRDVMDSFTHPQVEKITLCWSSQVAKSETLQNCIGYVICQDPAPSMIVYPIQALAERASGGRMKILFTETPEIAKRYHKDESNLAEHKFDGMSLTFATAGSAPKLAEKACKYVFIDEADKNPDNAGKEASPESLAGERTKTFLGSKEFLSSTPVFTNGPTWKGWENADVKCKYHVPCPHCGKFQHLFFEQIKWDKDYKTPDEAKSTAYYECIHCKGAIKDYHKPTMLEDGVWVDEITGRALKIILDDEDAVKSKLAFHLNAIYSPFPKITFGAIAKKFLESKNDPGELQNFKNSWLAEPWVNKELSLSENIVLKRQTNIPEFVVPDDTILLTGGVDVQQDCFYFTIRAWSYGLTSQNILHGVVDTWYQIEEIMERHIFEDRQGQRFIVNLCGIDSGDQTADVYDFCAMHPDWAVPTKGSSRPLNANFRISTINKVESKGYGMRLILFDPNRYKDMIAGRMQRPNGNGSWMVYQGCDKEYANQVTNEERVKNKDGTFVWVKKTTTAPNHYLDCETNAFVAADLCQIRYLQPPDNSQVKNIIQVPENQNKQNNNVEDIRANMQDIREHRSNYLQNRR